MSWILVVVTNPLSAVVVNYRTSHDLEEFLQSWVKFAPVDSDLTIVNVQPRSDDIEVADRYVGGSIDYDFWRENVGYGVACNAAGSRKEGAVLAFFNADVVLTEGSLQACTEALLGNPEWAVLGPRQVSHEKKLTHAGIVGPTSQPKHRGWQQRDRGQYADVLDDVPTVSGAAYFIKRQVWDELCMCTVFQQIAPEATGAFLPTKHYWNETWTSYHVIAHGQYKVVYFGPVTIVHKWHRASPMGGWGEQNVGHDRAMFREACKVHGIPCD